MPRKAEELSAKAVRDLTKPGRYAVGGVPGLLLRVTDTGSRNWLLRILFKGHRHEIGLGGFPEVSLSNARDRAREMNAQARRGLNPLVERAREVVENTDRSSRAITFEKCARECHELRKLEFKNPKHSAQWIKTLENYAFEQLGGMFVDQIESRHVIAVLKPIWGTKTETAARVRGRIQAVLAYAKAMKYRDGENPAVWADNLKLVLPTPRKVKRVQHHSRLPVAELPRLMAALVRREGVAARALEFTILTAARVSEVRFAKAREFNLEKRIWTVPSDRMKGGLVHRVPLSDRAVKILLETGQLDKGGLVFPGTTNHGALSENTQNDVIKQLHEFDVAVEGPGFFDPDSERIATAHGMRSTFKDWARTMTSFPDEASELSLAHVNNDSTRSAYARDELLDIRRTMMEQWSLFCLPPKAENVVVLAAHRKG